MLIDYINSGRRKNLIPEERRRLFNFGLRLYCVSADQSVIDCPKKKLIFKLQHPVIEKKLLLTPGTMFNLNNLENTCFWFKIKIFSNIIISFIKIYCILDSGASENFTCERFSAKSLNVEKMLRIKIDLETVYFKALFPN
ncbi:hypothetical protein AYI68_g3510 [Smittium mucronatum]|uniref:Uncharacterized protein n=1 Tax=Smittium mucronatum TaxID=133383 RepID=A0A1R0GZN6_9FUNG|nr:hypothetical protein AYI68_g3510 [Smittium mucronatum]